MHVLVVQTDTSSTSCADPDPQMEEPDPEIVKSRMDLPSLEETDPGSEEIAPEPAPVAAQLQDEPAGLTQTLQNEWLGWHNRFRREQMSSNMLELVYSRTSYYLLTERTLSSFLNHQEWDNKLAAAATEWTRACQWKYRDFTNFDDDRLKGFIGQQLYFSSSDLDVELVVKVRTKIKIHNKRI